MLRSPFARMPHVAEPGTFVAVGPGVGVGGGVFVGSGVFVGVLVSVATGVFVAVGEGPAVGVLVFVGVGVIVGVFVGVGPGVFVAAGGAPISLRITLSTQTFPTVDPPRNETFASFSFDGMTHVSVKV